MAGPWVAEGGPAKMSQAARATVATRNKAFVFNGSQPNPCEITDLPRRRLSTAGAGSRLHRSSTRQMCDLSDEALLMRIKLRDCAAFEELSNRYRTKIVNFATRTLRDPMAANDVAQETLLAIYLKARTFIAGYRVRPWLFKIAYNKSLDYIRQSGPVASDDVEIASTESPEDSIHQRMVARRLRAAIATLRSEERDAMMLRHDSDLPYDQIAQRMRIPVGTVKTHLFRARNRLKSRLEFELAEA